ncbi:MAG: hypothetical protein P4M08_02080 [Oligoflexia bacterium]|nr:hypothetical protein [Oligoflexia bacterium]
MKKVLAVAVLLAVFSGCASLNSIQERDLDKWEREGIAVHAKDPTTGALLGILPGVGSFYTGQIGLGVVDLLTWPLSICWDTSAGYQGAKVKNWEASSFYVEDLEKNRKMALGKLEDMRDRGKIAETDYRAAKREIDNASLKEFEREYDLDSKVRGLASESNVKQNAGIKN